MTKRVSEEEAEHAIRSIDYEHSGERLKYWKSAQEVRKLFRALLSERAELEHGRDHLRESLYTEARAREGLEAAQRSCDEEIARLREQIVCDHREIAELEAKLAETEEQVRVMEVALESSPRSILIATARRDFAEEALDKWYDGVGPQDVGAFLLWLRAVAEGREEL